MTFLAIRRVSLHYINNLTKHVSIFNFLLYSFKVFLFPTVKANVASGWHLEGERAPLTDIE